MDDNTWKLAQMLMWFLGTQTIILIAILGVIWNSISTVKKDLKDVEKTVIQIDKEVAIITATLKFNGYDLSRHKAEGE